MESITPSLFIYCLLLISARAASVRRTGTNFLEDPLKKFTFTEPSTLTICTSSQDLTAASEIKLAYNIDSTPVQERDFLGTLSTSDSLCADFDVSTDFDELLSGQHEFDFYAYDTSPDGGYHGRALLTIPEGTVDVIKVNSEPDLYRSAGSSFTGCLDSNIADACYSDDITIFMSGGSKCDEVLNEHTTGDGDETVTVCQPLQMGNPDDVSGSGTETISFLQYPSQAADPSEPALSVTNEAASDSVEMVLLDSSGNPVGAYSCDAQLLCSFDASLFTPSTNLVSAIIVNVDDQNTATAVSQDDVQDADLSWYYEDPYVEFALANVGSDQNYAIGLTEDETTAIATATLDCSSIAPDSLCFGFLLPGEDHQSGFITISLEAGGDTSVLHAPFSKSDDAIGSP